MPRRSAAVLSPPEVPDPKRSRHEDTAINQQRRRMSVNDEQRPPTDTQLTGTTASATQRLSQAAQTPGLAARLFQPQIAQSEARHRSRAVEGDDFMYVAPAGTASCIPSPDLRRVRAPAPPSSSPSVPPVRRPNPPAPPRDISPSVDLPNLRPEPVLQGPGVFPSAFDEPESDTDENPAARADIARRREIGQGGNRIPRSAREEAERAFNQDSFRETERPVSRLATEEKDSKTMVQNLKRLAMWNVDPLASVSRQHDQLRLDTGDPRLDFILIIPKCPGFAMLLPPGQVDLSGNMRLVLNQQIRRWRHSKGEIGFLPKGRMMFIGTWKDLELWLAFVPKDDEEDDEEAASGGSTCLSTVCLFGYMISKACLRRNIWFDPARLHRLNLSKSGNSHIDRVTNVL
jgi:hypothetical protein